MKRWLSLFLLGSILTLSFALKESLGFRSDAPKSHWADSMQKGGSIQGKEPPAAILSPGTRWGTLQPVPTALAYHAAVAVEVSPDTFKVFLFGGFNGTNFLSETYEYDINTDTWATKASMPGGPRGRIAAAVVKGKVYVIGGTDDFYNALDRCEVYDPQTNTWAAMSPMPTPRQFLSAVSWKDTLIYAIGGDGGAGFSTSLNTVEVFDPLTDTWMPADTFFVPRRSHASAIFGDKIFVAMGWNGKYLQSMEAGLIDSLPTKIIWSPVEDAPYAASRVAGAAFLGQFYITGGDSMGGDSTGIFTEKTYRYTPGTGIWEMMPDKPTAVANTQAFVGVDAETLLLYPGGWTNAGKTQVHESFPLAIHDAEAVSISVPPDSVCIDSTVAPKVTVENSGFVLEPTFDVTLDIFLKGDTLPLYAETLTVDSLDSGEQAVLIFKSWTDSLDTSYTVVLTTHLAIDGNPTNDSVSKEVFTRVRDAGPIAIVEPPDTVLVDSTYIPEVDIENFGCQVESLGVVFSIYYEDTTGTLIYSDTLSVDSLFPGDSSLTFSPWTDTTADTSYFIIVCTQYPQDARPGNDCLTKSSIATLSSEIEEGGGTRVLSSKFRLWNSPNPSYHSTFIHFSLPSSGRVSLKVYDLSGRSIKTLFEESLKADEYEVFWDGRDDAGRKVPSGVYLSRLQVGRDRFVRKIVLIQ